MGNPRGGPEGRGLYLNLDAGKGSQDDFLQESRFGSPCAMEGEVSGDDVLMQKLKKSRHRFQRHMQQLLEKVGPPPARWVGRGAGEEGEDRVGGWGEEGSGGVGTWSLGLGVRGGRRALGAGD